jgi:SAM-dependent methyltransferase
VSDDHGPRRFVTPSVATVAGRPRKPWLLRTAFFADKAKHRLRQVGDVAASRDAFERTRFNNLDYLLHTRYDWMRRWINEADVVVEIGAGAGFSPRYLQRDVLLTDVVASDWIDVAMDGASMALGDASVDVVIVSNALHHFPSPAAFIREACRVLKPDGLVLINDAYCSLALRLILRLAQQEGYSYDVDVFDPDAVANDPQDPWSGNNAVANLLFDRKDEFEARFADLRIVGDAPCEFLLFVLSGGVTSKLPVPELPTALLAGIARLDRLLVAAAARLFALSRQTVLRKVGPASATGMAAPGRRC